MRLVGRFQRITLTVLAVNAVARRTGNKHARNAKLIHYYIKRFGIALAQCFTLTAV